MRWKSKCRVPMAMVPTVIGVMAFAPSAGAASIGFESVKSEGEGKYLESDSAHQAP
jgi:hypothetical protein